jgi:hypothetical protein
MIRLSHLSDELWTEEQRRIQATGRKTIEDAFSGKKLNPKEVYPEFTFEEPYCLWKPFAPVQFFFPFFRRVILPVVPFVDELAFRGYYGVSLDDLVAMVKEQRVLPICSQTYENYPEWYGPLFGVSHVPYAGRFMIVMDAFLPSSQTYSSKYQEIKELMRGRFQDARLPQDFLSLFTGVYGRTRRAEEEIFDDSVTEATRLTTLGYEELVKRCLETDSLAKCHLYLHHIGTLVSEPVLDSMGGWLAHNDGHITTVQELLRRFGAVRRSFAVLRATRSLMARLSIELGYGHPENYPVLDFLSKIDQLKEVDENYAVLASVQRYFENQQIARAFDELHEAELVVGNINEEIKRVSKHYKLIKWGLYPAYTILSPVAARTLLSILPNVANYLTFPFAELAAAGSVAIEDVRNQLNALALFLTGAIHGKNSAPFIIWKRRSQTD